MNDPNYNPVQNSSTAIISLVAGILGLSFVPGIGSIVAVIVGNMAKKEIAESGGRLGGEGMANIGVILGWIGIALTVGGICCFVLSFALPFLLAFLGIATESISAAPGLLSLFL